MLDTSQLPPALRGLIEEYKAQIGELSDRCAGLSSALRDAQEKLGAATEELARLHADAGPPKKD